MLGFSFAVVEKAEVEGTAYAVPNRLRNQYAAWFRFFLQACRRVHAVALNITVVGNCVAKLDSNPEDNALLLRFIVVSFAHRLLDFDRALKGLDGAVKLGQKAIAHHLYEPSLCSAIVGSIRLSRQARSLSKVPDHVRNQDCGTSTVGRLDHGRTLDRRFAWSKNDTTSAIWPLLGSPNTPSFSPRADGAKGRMSRRAHRRHAKIVDRA